MAGGKIEAADTAIAAPSSLTARRRRVADVLEVVSRMSEGGVAPLVDEVYAEISLRHGTARRKFDEYVKTLRIRGLVEVADGRILVRGAGA